MLSKVEQFKLIDALPYSTPEEIRKKDEAFDLALEIYGKAQTGPKLSAFVEKTTRHKLDPWQYHLCDLLSTLATSKGRRLLVAAPPQGGKSIIVSQRFPAWLIAQKPTHRVKLACYNITHAARFGRIVRDLMQSGEFAAMFPDERLRLPVVSSTEEWSTKARRELRDGQPSFKAMGLSTGFVGQGADCFTGETLIKTEHGSVTIKQLFQLVSPPKVYGYDHETERIVLRRIEAMREIESSEIVEVTTRDGHRFRCTPDHRIYVPGRGYIAAETLTTGTPLSACDPEVHVMRKAVLAQTVGSPEVGGERLSRCLLLTSLFTRASRHKECRALPAMRSAKTRASRLLVLFRWMQRRIMEGLQGNAAYRSKSRLFLRSIIQAKNYSHSVLFPKVCGYGSLVTNAWQGKLSLQNRYKLRDVVHGNATSSDGSRRSEVRDMSDTRNSMDCNVAGPANYAHEFTCPPYRSRSAQQHTGEPHYALQELPLSASQISADAVALVRRLRRQRVKVYDLQVEGCCSFFAENILVHNCLIIDDPYASPQDAYSPIVNASTHGFWSDTAKPRLNDDSNVVVMFHRYTETDLAGWLMEMEPDEWELIRYAAIADGDYVHPDTGKVYPDPLGREEGERFSPRFSDGWYETQQQNTFIWLSQFQGRPSAREGGMFKIHQLPLVDVAPVEAKRIRYWDLGGSDSKKSDYTVGCLMSQTPEGLFYVEDVKRGQWSPGERNEHIRTTAEADREMFDGTVATWIEKVPGLGIEVINNLVRYLAGYTVHTEMAKNDKVTRADPLASQCEAGNVRVLRAPWTAAFRSELTAFPNGKNDDQCLVADTLIKTANGDVAIESIRAGDFVHTRAGLKQVMFAGVTKRRTTIVRLELADGRYLEGTPNHPILTLDRGFVEMQKVDRFDKVVTWQTLKQSNITACVSGDTRMQKTARIVSTLSRVLQTGKAVLTRSIVKYGRSITAQFRPGGRFTTKIAILLTMILQTFKPFLQMSTDVSTRWILLPTETRRSSWLTWRPFGPRLLSGMELKRVANGTNGTAGSHGTLETLNHFPAVGASRALRARLLAARVRMECDSVPESVLSVSGIERVAAVFQRLVRTVLRCLRGWHAQKVVHIRALRVYELSERRPVYNLTVVGAHEYFANGILVHNCDAASGAFSKLSRDKKWTIY